MPGKRPRQDPPLTCTSASPIADPRKPRNADSGTFLTRKIDQICNDTTTPLGLLLAEGDAKRHRLDVVRGVLESMYRANMTGYNSHRTDYTLECPDICEFRWVRRGHCPYNGGKVAVDIQHAFVCPEMRCKGLMATFVLAIDYFFEITGKEVASIYMLNGMVENQPLFGIFWDKFLNGAKTVTTQSITGYFPKHNLGHRTDFAGVV